MRILIVEDDPVAAEELRILCLELRPECKLLGITDRVSSTIEWLNQHAFPDLIFMNTQLPDGTSFEIFPFLKFECPVIFITAYESVVLDAFKMFCIDYLLKPVSRASLKHALDKYDHLSARAKNPVKPYKTRFLARRGTRSFFINATDIAYFSADNKIVYLNAQDGTRYLVDYTLENLEKLLDPGHFFRLNRSIIVQASAIQHLKPYLNSRLKLTIKMGAGADELFVTRERVTAFRQWADS